MAASKAWGKTLNLPEHHIPMRANLPDSEPKRLEQWQSQAWWDQLAKVSDGRPYKALHDGPPYANGPIHIGHAVNKTLKDIINRWTLIDGYQTSYQPGWDCHGLPIELKVEQKFKQRGSDDPRGFIEKCRAYAATQIEEQKQGFTRLGVMAPWQEPYTTMEPAVEARALRALAQLLQKGYLERGMRPVHWCGSCRSALAEAEVEYQEVTSHSIYVKFPVKSSEQLAKTIDAFAASSHGLANVSALIWTTTPWTIPSNLCICINPNLSYGLFKIEQDAVILAVEAVEKLRETLDLPLEAIGEKTVLGSELTWFTAQHPLYDLGCQREAFIVTGDHVTADTGTGLVHTAPDHGMEDWIASRDHEQFSFRQAVNASGVFIDQTPVVAGQHYQKSNPLVLEALQQSGNLLQNSTLKHSVAHCWRHHKPVFFRATAQWFIAMDQHNLRQRCLEALKDVNFVPSKSRERLESMIRERPDWCISRQRFWGLPMGLFTHEETGDIHPRNVEALLALADKVEQGGVEVWQDLSLKDLIGEDGEDYLKSQDVLDVWFDSGISHQSVLTGQFYQDHQPMPRVTYLEGSDQHRGWFQSSLITSVALTDRAPFKDLVTHGFVVDDSGDKMSKSKGNVLSPAKVFQSFGADILRLWVASSDFSGEIMHGQTIMQQKADLYRRIRNTLRFLIGNASDLPSNLTLPSAQFVDLDRWLWKQCQSLATQVAQDYRDYQFAKAMSHIHLFCRETLGSFYLDVIKDRIYTLPKDAPARRSAQIVMKAVGEVLTTLIAPVLPFTAEECWQSIQPDGEIKSVFFTTWQAVVNAPNHEAIPTETKADWSALLSLAAPIRKALEQAKKDGIVKNSMAAKVVLTPNSQAVKDALDLLGDEAAMVYLVAKLQVGEVDTNSSSTKVGISLADGDKCERCWYTVDAISHEGICSRCALNVQGEAETRQWG